MPEKILTTEAVHLEDEKKREELTPESVLLENNQEAEAFMMSDAALYLNMTRANLTLILKRLEKEGKTVKVYRKKHGGIGRYLLKRDLDELRRVEPVNREQVRSA